MRPRILLSFFCLTTLYLCVGACDNDHKPTVVTKDCWYLTDVNSNCPGWRTELRMWGSASDGVTFNDADDAVKFAKAANLRLCYTEAPTVTSEDAGRDGGQDAGPALHVDVLVDGGLLYYYPARIAKDSTK